jgi:hypothetical protein
VSNNPQQDSMFSSITTPLGDELTWRWEDRQSALLCEFSWEKKDRILTSLRNIFSEEWNKKTIKKAPKVIKDELGELARLSKKQLIFTRSTTENTPTLALIWWPWGHGATYSMRIKVLSAHYDQAALQLAQTSLITRIVQRISIR